MGPSVGPHFFPQASPENLKQRCQPCLQWRCPISPCPWELDFYLLVTMLQDVPWELSGHLIFASEQPFKDDKLKLHWIFIYEDNKNLRSFPKEPILIFEYVLFSVALSERSLGPNLGCVSSFFPSIFPFSSPFYYSLIKISRVTPALLHKLMGTETLPCVETTHPTLAHNEVSKNLGEHLKLWKGKSGKLCLLPLLF